MRTAFCIAATLVASVAASEPQNAQECRDIYQEHYLEPSSTPTSKCEALVELSKCAGAFPKDDETEKILISKQSQFCETIWDKLDAPSVKVAKDNMMLTVDDAKNIEFHRHRRQTINVFTMDENIAKLLASMDTMKTTLDEKMAEIDTKLDANTQATENALNMFKGQVNGDLAKQATAMEKQSADMATAMEKQSADMNDALAKQSQTVDTAIDDLKDDVDASSTQMQNKLKEEVTTLTGAIADPVKHMWSGGSKGASNGGGWADFVLDRVEYDTAAPYFKKSSNTRFQALKDGLYSIRWNYRSYTHNTCYRQARIYINGQRVVMDTHSYLYHWQEHIVQVTWPIKAGQVFYMQAYTHCGNPYRWEHGSAWNNAYNRVQVLYEGQINTKACTSNQGLC